MILKDLLTNGFKLGSDDQEKDELRLAMNSLKIALKSYFSSHIAFNIRQYNDLTDFEADKKDIGKYLGYSTYPEVFFTTIVNLQHFFELILKYILEKENVIYSLKTLNDILLVDKLLHSENTDDSNGDSVEFGEALKRVKKLLGDNRIRANNEQIKIFLGYKLSRVKGIDKVEFMNSQALEKLNELRNRLWHKGLFILSYNSFDIFMIQNMLPIIMDVFSIDYFKGYANWKYFDLYCKEDPIKLLVQEGVKSYDKSRIAVIKEMGRAAYNCEVPNDNSPFYEVFRVRTIQEKFHDYKHFDEKYNEGGVWDCPICGFHSFVGIVGDFDVEEPPFSRPITFLDSIKCLYCDFTIDRNYNTNGKGFKISNYNFWES